MVESPRPIRAVDLMGPIETVSAHATAREAVKLLLAHERDGLIVVDESARPVGIVMRQDFLALFVPRLFLSEQAVTDEFLAETEDVLEDAGRTLIRELMGGRVFTVSADADLQEVVHFLVDKEASLVVVEEKGRLAGSITPRDVFMVLFKGLG
ncbi:MAG: CBS domain-containing protein [Firmicutes bacterium]|nr:CBS domain-containing protein [Bacillota bacterium]